MSVRPPKGASGSVQSRAFAPEATLCVKNVKQSKVRWMRAVLASRTELVCASNATAVVPDCDTGHEGEFLIYANYETAETAQRAKQSIESWLASSFATSGRWRPVVLLKDEMKLRGNLVATKKRTRATMKTDTVPPLSGPEFPCLHLCDANRDICNSGGKGNIGERGKLSLVNPSIDNSDLLVSDESPDTSGCSTGTTTSPIPRVQTQSISVVDLTNDTDADSDRYGLWKEFVFLQRAASFALGVSPLCRVSP